MTEVYIEKVNKDVRQIHSSQKRIIEEIKKLKAGSQELGRQAQSWMELYDSLSASLKEAGDILNWYNVLETRAAFIKDKLKERVSRIDEAMATNVGEEKKEELKLGENKVEAENGERVKAEEAKDEEIVVVIETRKNETALTNAEVDVEENKVRKIENELEAITTNAQREMINLEDRGETTGNISEEKEDIIKGDSKRELKEAHEDALVNELSLIHICRCRRYAVCRSRWSPYH
eukprot:TRINITY_DN10851_c0_g2_i5.p1 TRINITY_DN10851_c0_g2~~TRINITY_DN10851_c0_g2_i5.p1  ORF type:complete len:234 (+),score=68.67 TRINITY_DN10851_c0_g2_i5:188-889(+)